MTWRACSPAFTVQAISSQAPRMIRYNCVAWAAEDEEHWWWPDEDSYWPEGVPREETIAALVAAFEKLGFVSCNDPLLEAAYEKVAIYAAPDGIPTHVARQLPSGLWSSKLGQLQDIEHRLEDLGAPCMAIAHCLKRERAVGR